LAAPSLWLLGQPRQEKDRLKKEMLMKLRETKASLLRMTDNHVCSALVRT